jgi:ATP-dependent DNA helicase DinG
LTESLADRTENALLRELPAAGMDGYAVRPRQVDMALTVADAITTGGLFLLEAGTGVGKSIAYILPSLLSGVKTVVSTATLTLQDQLVTRDIPSLVKSLGLEVEVAVLKGRRRYLCNRKWSLASVRFGGFPGLGEWAGNTGSGDVSHCPVSIPPDIWRHVSGDSLDCSGTTCPFFSKCFYFNARSEARRAGLLIVNHHLLVSGMQVEDLIPEADLLVIDEGHRLEDAASECLGLSLGEGMLFPLYDGIGFCELEAERKAGLLEKVRELSAAVTGLTHGITETASWHPVDRITDLERTASLAAELHRILETEPDLAATAQAAGYVEETVRNLLAVNPEDYCTFVEVSGSRSVIRSVPLDVGADLASIVYSAFSTVVLTSATLTVDGSFEFFSGRLGVGDCYSHSFGSPFDYSGQAVLSVPDNLPRHDSHDELTATAWEWGRRIASLLDGRIIMLFTSYRNLTLVRDRAVDDLPEGLRLLVQGDKPRKSILDEFRADRRAIILGTTSFWEGVDLPGDLLQAVIIDRIPFPSPGHPLVAARLDAIERGGGNSFLVFTLPAAAVRLKQGVGRLLRSSSDRGVVLILDHRLRSAGYGSVILRSLPAFRQVPDSEVQDFIMEHCLKSGVSHPEGSPDGT